MTSQSRVFSTLMTSQEYIDRELKYVQPYYEGIPIVLDRAERIYYWDVNGERYYDGMGGFGVAS